MYWYALIVIAIIIFIWTVWQPPMLAPVGTVMKKAGDMMPSNVNIGTGPTLQAPIAPSQVLSNNTIPWCQFGVDCNEAPVTQDRAYVGAPPICGVDQAQYACSPADDKHILPWWNNLGVPCSASMLSNCPSAAAPVTPSNDAVDLSSV